VDTTAVLFFSGARNLAYNNTLYGGGGGKGIQLDAAANPITDAELKNNIIYNFTTAIDLGTATGTVQTTNQTTDPLFLNPLGTTPADFKLQSNSTAKEAGTAIPSVTEDFFDLSRPQFSLYDIGAHEIESNIVGLTLIDDFSSSGLGGWEAINMQETLGVMKPVDYSSLATAVWGTPTIGPDMRCKFTLGGSVITDFGVFIRLVTDTDSTIRYWLINPASLGYARFYFSQ
jgi:hypothetical protein